MSVAFRKNGFPVLPQRANVTLNPKVIPINMDPMTRKYTGNFEFTFLNPNGLPVTRWITCLVDTGGDRLTIFEASQLPKDAFNLLYNQYKQRLADGNIKWINASC